jgi:hypothetical protein
MEEIRLSMEYYDYDRIRKFKPITKFDEIEVGKLLFYEVIALI